MTSTTSSRLTFLVFTSGCIALALLFHYAEHLIHFWRQTGDFAAANRKLLDEMVWAHFLAIQILLIVMILAYVTMREFTRLIGRHKVFEILFGKPPATPESRDE